ncbi:unnamed protein product [Tilletia controversa]|nr:unnamed protein product [Tilletia controversa]
MPKSKATKTSAAPAPSSAPTQAIVLASDVGLSVRNANDLYSAVNAAVQKWVDARPKGTSKSYDPKQAKWRTFCDERKFDDGMLVTEAKILLWLQAVIVPAGNSKKKEKVPGPDGQLRQAQLSTKRSLNAPTLRLASTSSSDSMSLESRFPHFSKKTHLNRGGGAHRAEDNGASEAQIRRAGRWVVEKMQGCYLTGLPRESMRAMAGFSVTPGAYHIARASVEPPSSLQQQIFPAADAILAQVEQGKVECDLAAQGFLRLLQYLRSVLLQDAVALRRVHPALAIFSHPIFGSQEFLAFEQQLKASIETPEKPVSVAVS